MSFTKITTTELNSRGATTLPNQPAMSATTLKQEFDAPAKNIVAPKFNNLVDELEATTAAANLGAVAPTGRIGNNVQGVMNSISSDLDTLAANTSTAIAEAHAHSNKALLDDYTQTEADLADAVLQKHSHPNKAVIDKFADDGTGLTYDGNPLGAVTSVNSQTGAVVLTASDVGALPSTTAIPTKTSDLTNDSGFITSGDIPTIPTKTSDLTNDSNFVSDPSYVHTDNNYDATAKTIVDGATTAIAAKSTVAWNQIDTTGTKIAEITIDGVKTDVKATGGGGSADAYKTIDAGGQSFVASGADTFKINAGSNVTIEALTGGDKGIKISATGGGQSTGDMLMSDYDNDSTIKNASSTGNGIKDYVASAISGKVDTAGDGLAKEGTTIALDLGMLTGSNLTKAVSGKDIKDALDEKADTSDIPTPAEKATWDAKVSESLLKSTVGWTGKNLLAYPYHETTKTSNGITFTDNGDGSVTANGTATAVTYFTFCHRTVSSYTSSHIKVGEKYVLSGCPTGGSNSTYSLGIQDVKNGVTHVIANEYGSGKEINITEASEQYYGIYITIYAGATVNNLTFYPMFRDASITDDTYEPYHESVEEEIEQIYADNGVLGAKNLVENKAVARTSSGVLFTVNSDGSVTVNGTGTNTSAGVFEINPHFTLPAGNYILSGSPHNVYSETGFRLQIVNKTDSRDIVFCETDEDIPFTIGENKDIAIRIWYRATPSTSGNDVIFYPMIRLASDPDDTYVPYAMTNRELTEDRYYHAGDTVNVSLMNFAGLITNSSKEIRFTIPLMKDLSKITGITFKNTTTVGIRKPTGGYVIDGTISSGYNITILAKSGNLLSLRLTKTDDSAFDATNNTPLDVAFTGNSNDSVITFS